MGLLRKLAGVLLFFGLFAFALNNQHEAIVHFVFGLHWQGPMIFIVLAAFASGCAFGVLTMGLRRLLARRLEKPGFPATQAPPPAQAEPAAAPREAL